MSQRTADGFRQFVYQGPDMLKLQLERDESEETVAHYTMGAGLEAMRREAESSSNHSNHRRPRARPLGPTLALTGADEARIAEGDRDTYRHDAWGVLLASTGSTVNPHTYVGQQRYYRMPNASMYHLGFRDYAQGVGRFAVVEPLLAERQLGAPPYQYCLNLPVSNVDPSGGSAGHTIAVIALGGILAGMLYFWVIRPLRGKTPLETRELVGDEREMLRRAAEKLDLKLDEAEGYTFDVGDLPGREIACAAGKGITFDPAFFGQRGKGDAVPLKNDCYRAGALVHELSHAHGLRDDVAYVMGSCFLNECMGRPGNDGVWLGKDDFRPDCWESRWRDYCGRSEYDYKKHLFW